MALMLLIGCGSSQSPSEPRAVSEGPALTLTVSETAQQLVVASSSRVVTLDKQSWSLELSRADGRSCLREAAPSLPGLLDPVPNLDRLLYDNLRDGIDSAYPGLESVSYRPLAYLAGGNWQHVTAVQSQRVEGNRSLIEAQTSDGQGAEIELVFGADGAVELRFRPRATGVEAVAESFDAPLLQHYFGGGQRFLGLNQRGKSVPLWISHGGGADRYLSTNEIATSFFWSPSGWGAWADSDARGEINFGVLTERADAVNFVVEDDHLNLVLYCGSPQEIVSTHTARAGRPAWVPPDWMWRPMVWQDSDTSTESVRALVDGMLERQIPLGAVWLDNPWDAGKATFDFDPQRFADPDALIDEVHAKGVRLMVWLSPFVTDPLLESTQSNGWMVTGLRTDNNDATYYELTDPLEPTRGLDPHLDFTNPAAVAWWQAGLEALIARGIDGVKVDRGEEDLSDGSIWHNGLPNRLNHNPYVLRYHHTIYDAFKAQRPDDDFVILSRGGWNGDARWSAHWAADNMSGPGVLGLGQALNSLLTLSASGFPFSGADIGGYGGTRQDAGASAFNDPLQLPTEQTYIRWLQLGALSPVMQTPVPPWWVSDRAITLYRRYAVLHDRLVPYTARWARAAIEQGIPIVRPMPYAFPDDLLAVAVEDQYLYGPDLLVAPVTNLDALLDFTLRPIYLPAGRWTDFWTGEAHQGPKLLVSLVPIERLPMFVRDGAELPPGVSAAQLP